MNKVFIVHGIVQGVGYRYFVYRQARFLGLRGWVANRSDGTVEVHASGDESSLNQLEELLRSGPTGAHVTKVDVIISDNTEDNLFEIVKERK